MILIIKHISIEGPGTIGEFFKKTGREIQTIELDKNELLPESLSKIEAIIVLGGPMNVYEEEKYPFLKNEDAFLKRAIKEKIFILGICLGAQLLAKAYGAKVKAAQEKEIGLFKVNLTEEGMKDPLFFNLNRQLDVFQWHGDTFEIPDNSVLLATSPACANQAVRFSENVYGLQFHIEVSGSMIKEWVEEYFERSDAQSQQKGEQMLVEYANVKEKFNKQSNSIYLNFERLVIG